MYLKCILRGTYLRCRIHAGYIRNTCGIHVSSEVIKIHAGYMRDTCGIHAGYIWDTCGTRISGVWGNVSMPSWRAAHLSGHPCPPCAEMEAEARQGSCSGSCACCGTCQGRQGSCQARIQSWPQVHVGLEIRILEYIPMFPTRIVSECILCVMYLRVKIHCILNVSQMYLECIVKKDTYPLVRYVSNDSQSYRYKCILMYLDVS